MEHIHPLDSRIPAQPKPLLFLFDGANLRAHCEGAACWFSPPAQWTAAMCFPFCIHTLFRVHGTQKPILGVLMSPLVVAVAVRWPRLAWEAPPQCKDPVTPRRGSAEIGDAALRFSPATSIPCGTEFVTMGTLVQDEVTSCSHGVHPPVGKRALPKSDQTPLGQGWEQVPGADKILAGGCTSPGPQLSLAAAGGHRDTPGCPAALASLPYASSQLSRGSLVALLTVGRRPGLIKIVLGCI